MGDIKSQYTKMETHRDPYLERARDCAALTLPYLFTDEGDQESLRFPTPYQSVGARGVNNSSSALTLTMLPPGQPFYRYVVSKEDQEKAKQISPTAKSEIEKNLSKNEVNILRHIEADGVRAMSDIAFKQLVTGGNSMIYFPMSGDKPRAVGLQHYVVDRSPNGTLVKAILKETMSKDAVPDDLKDYLTEDSKYELFTCQKRIAKDKYLITQEFMGNKVYEKTVDENEAPFLVLRFFRVDGESYGRSLVDMYYGDLQSLEGLTRSIVEGSGIAAKVVFLVNPNGTTSIKELTSVRNGGFVEGNPEDVIPLQVQKHSDFAVAFQAAKAIEDRLSSAFLLTENVIRNAERVTAEEVRLVSQAIERQLGGMYSLMSQEFQLPLVKKYEARLRKAKKIDNIPDRVELAVITGIDALGRGSDLNKIDLFLGGVSQQFGPEAMAQYVNLGEYMRRRATALAVDADGLIRTDEEIQQQQQQAQQMQLTETLGPEAIRQVGANSERNSAQ